MFSSADTRDPHPCRPCYGSILLPVRSSVTISDNPLQAKFVEFTF
jgi:hypothetical protein